MFTTHVQPRFAETDALGHINNTAVPIWFEEGRRPLFRLFNPDLKVEAWNLILRRVEIDFLAQLHLGKEVTIETELAKIGTTSVSCSQRAIQDGVVAARGVAVMVHFDYQTQKSAPIPDDIRRALADHLAEPE